MKDDISEKTQMIEDIKKTLQMSIANEKELHQENKQVSDKLKEAKKKLASA